MDEEYKTEQIEIWETELETIEDEILMSTQRLQMLDLERKQSAETLGRLQEKRTKAQHKIKKLNAENPDLVE